MQKKANRYFIPIDGMPIEVSEEVYRRTTAQSGTLATMPRRTASAAAPRRKSGSATEFAPDARSTLPERKCLLTRPYERRW